MKNNNKKLTVDFIGIGAPKCGTEWIADCLKEHPNIDFSTHKEVNFFLSPSKGTTQFAYNNMRIKSWEDYKKEFSGKGKIKGEFSNHYFWDTKALEKIKKTFPDVKIIVALRDPIKYLYSIYWYLKYSNQYYSIPNTFEDALKNAQEYDLYNIEKAKFGKHLELIFKIFNKNNVYIVLVDDIKNNSKNVIKELYKFLGVNDQFLPTILNKKVNKTTQVRFTFLFKPVQILMRALEKAGLSWFLNYIMNSSNPIKFIYRNFFFSSNKYPKIKSITEKRLKREFKKDIELLEVLLNRDLTNWKSS